MSFRKVDEFFQTEGFSKKHEDFEVVEFMGISTILKTIMLQHFS